MGVETTYEIHFRLETSYLRAVVSGDLNRETDEEIDAEIREACEARGARLLLVDIRHATSRLSLFENHEAARTFRQRMGMWIRAVAIVDGPAFRSNSEMFELTSVNRGATVRFFESEEEAEAWLESFSVRADHGEARRI